MEKFLIFMYRFWIGVLGIALIAPFLCCGGMDLYLRLLPSVVLITLYYVSTQGVRLFYRRTDEVRRRAHYLRGLFGFLTSVGWIVFITAYFIALLER